MARSYDFRTNLIRQDNSASTHIYVRAVVTETSYTTTSSTFSYSVYIGVDSKFYHYKLNNYLEVYWGGTLISGSASTAYGEIIVGACSGSSGSPACSYHGTSGQSFSNSKLLASGTITISNKSASSYAKNFKVVFTQKYAKIDNTSNTYVYKGTLSKDIVGTVVKSSIDTANVYLCDGWAFIPTVADTKLVVYAKVYNSSGTLLKTYSDTCDAVRSDVTSAHGQPSGQTSGWTINWDLVTDVGRQAFTVKFTAKYDGGAEFSLGERTINTRNCLVTHNGTKWLGGVSYVHNGSSWVAAKRVYVYNGSSWV